MVCVLQIGPNCGLPYQHLMLVLNAYSPPPFLKCIVKGTDLLSELFDSGLDITEMVTLSKRIRKSAYNLMLYEGLESAAAAGALVVCSCPC